MCVFLFSVFLSRVTALLWCPPQELLLKNVKVLRVSVYITGWKMIKTGITVNWC